MEAISLSNKSNSELVHFALEKGSPYFVKIIQYLDACKILNLEEHDILANFSLYLLEKNARPVRNWENRSSFPTYMVKVFKNWIYREIKKERRYRQVKEAYSREKELFIDHRSNPEENYIYFENQERIMTTSLSCLKTMTAEDRILVYAIFHEGKKIKEIADDLNINLSTIYYRYYRILSHLRTCFANEGYGQNKKNTAETLQTLPDLMPV